MARTACDRPLRLRPYSALRSSKVLTLASIVVLGLILPPSLAFLGPNSAFTLGLRGSASKAIVSQASAVHARYLLCSSS